MTKKDKTQLAILAAIILIVLVVTVVYFRDRFLPKPVGAGEDLSAPTRPDAPVKIDTSILKNPAYETLKYYGPIEITPPPITRNNAAVSGEATVPENVDFEIETAPEAAAEAVPANGDSTNP